MTVCQLSICRAEDQKVRYNDNVRLLRILIDLLCTSLPRRQKPVPEGTMFIRTSFQY
jgi:hypothetical protein